MRISDWSSDVCSSDLSSVPHPVGRATTARSCSGRCDPASTTWEGFSMIRTAIAVAALVGMTASTATSAQTTADEAPTAHVRYTDLDLSQPDDMKLLHHRVSMEVGRAPCRARVCQEVLISGG